MTISSNKVIIITFLSLHNKNLSIHGAASWINCNNNDEDALVHIARDNEFIYE